MSARRAVISAAMVVLALIAAWMIATSRQGSQHARPVATERLVAHPRLNVVTSFSILADLVSNVGGSRVVVTSLVGRDGDTHAYEPSPADARAVASADLVIVNGLGLEGWLDRLIKASGYKGPVVVASRGVSPLMLARTFTHTHGATDTHGATVSGSTPGEIPDPHAWQNVANAKIYVRNIADALAASDPAGTADYAAHAAAYQQVLTALNADLLRRFGRLTAERRTIITSHAAFAYFGDAYGLTFISPQGVSTQSDPSAASVALLIRQIRAKHVSALFLENLSDPRLLEQIAAETSSKMGGTLYSDALSQPDGPAPTYVAMMRHNANALLTALDAQAPGATRTPRSDQ